MSRVSKIIENYTQIVTVTKEEYEAAQKSMTEDEFKKRFSTYKDFGKIIYQMKVIPTLEEVGHIMAYETANNVRTIKGCVVFFAVLTAVSLVISIASMVFASRVL